MTDGKFVIQFGGDRMEELVIRHGTRVNEALEHMFPDTLQKELGATDAEMVSLVGRTVASQMCNWVEMMQSCGATVEDAVEMMSNNVMTAIEHVQSGCVHTVPERMN